MEAKSNILSRLKIFLIGQSRNAKTVLVIFSDYILLLIAFWASLSLRINEIYIPDNLGTQLLIFLGPIIAIPVFYFYGLYKSLIRYSNYQSLLWIMIASSVYTLIWFLIVLISGVVIKPYDFLFINWLLSIFLVGGLRYLARWLLLLNPSNSSNILIYGAGSAGVQYRSAIWHAGNLKVVGFIDDDKSLQGRYVDGLKVYSPKDISSLVEKHKISEIIIAISRINRSKIREIINSLKKHSLIIRRTPSLADIASGAQKISDLKKIKIDDLLQREIRQPMENLIIRDIKDKNVLVIGAGGTIGAELCRQTLKHKANSISLLDISEASLYEIEQELKDQGENIFINSFIGDVADKQSLEKIIIDRKIQTIYHAAAYKHVPIVESNIIAGTKCNVLGTITSIEVALEQNIESYVFISTDKAVRSTNIMGATKRFAELSIQSITSAHKENNEFCQTRVSIVRFGNVLGSSGSVVPLFQKQIEKGGPITVTDENIIRYFMTIEEASQLVIQAGAMGENGDIFLLDMGEPVKISELAKDMIRLSGMTIRDEENPSGDIEIKYTGLRPGEKLYEELLIDDNSEATKHIKILRGHEPRKSYKIFEADLKNIKNAIDKGNDEELRIIFGKMDIGYNPQRSKN